MAKPSNYDKPFDYEHRFHAGNVGDVLKHCAMGAWARALPSDGVRWLVDTHAGDGMYRLPPTGAWLAGIGRLDALYLDGAPSLAVQYLEDVGDKRTPNKGGLYPGSPALLRAQTKKGDRLVLVELMDAPRAKLTAHYTDDAPVEVRGGDGFEVLPQLAGEASDAGVTFGAVIDPAFTQKQEWDALASSIVATCAANPKAALMVWYPIKSLMRPQALAAAVRKAGIAAAAIELVTTPLRLKRKVLNGSGVLFVNAPKGLLGALGATLPWLGEKLATPSGDEPAEWTATLRSWG